MKTSNIVVVTALSQLRDYCVKTQQELESLVDDLVAIKKTRRLTTEERTDKNEFDGSATAYCDVVRVIEAKMIEVVGEE